MNIQHVSLRQRAEGKVRGKGREEGGGRREQMKGGSGMERSKGMEMMLSSGLLCIGGIYRRRGQGYPPILCLETCTCIDVAFQSRAYLLA